MTRKSEDYARDDDTRDWLSHIAFHPTTQKAAPAGQIYPPPSARPFFKELHKSHVKTLTLRKVSSPISSFRAKREIYLAQRSNGERQMRSSRSTHAILSLPHKYRVPLRRKRSLGSARDDDTRERAISHSLSFLHVEGCPFGAVYPPPSARPFFKGLYNIHVKTPTLRKVSSPISSFRAEREIFLAHGKTGLRDGKKQKHPDRHENK